MKQSTIALIIGIVLLVLGFVYQSVIFAMATTDAELQTTTDTFKWLLIPGVTFLAIGIFLRHFKKI